MMILSIMIVGRVKHLAYDNSYCAYGRHMKFRTGHQKVPYLNDTFIQIVILILYLTSYRNQKVLYLNVAFLQKK